MYSDTSGSHFRLTRVLTWPTAIAWANRIGPFVSGRQLAIARMPACGDPSAPLSRARCADAARVDTMSMLEKAKSAASAAAKKAAEAKELAAKKAAEAKELAAKKATEAKELAAQKAEIAKEKAAEAAAKAKEMALATKEKDEFVERLMANHLVWSKDLKSDMWLMLKNNHLVLSLFFAHPKHDFSPLERRVCLVCSLCLGFGITSLLGLIKEEADEDSADAVLIVVLVGTVLQQIYDNLLRVFATCSCVQSCPAVIRICFEALGAIGLIFQFFFGVGFLLLGILLIQELRGDDAVGAAAWKFAIAKMNAWFFTSLITFCILFYINRRGQVRPDDPEEYKKWSEPQKGLFGTKKPKNGLWNEFIGENHTMADLPDTAPEYEYRACCMKRGQNTYVSLVKDQAPDVEKAAATTA